MISDNIYVSAYKNLGSNDYKVIPYKTYAPHQYVYTSGSVNTLVSLLSSISSSSDVQIFYGEKFLAATQKFRTPNNINEMFDSVMQTFYSPQAAALYGITNSSYTPTTTIYVISITQDIYGDSIVPNTISVRMGTSHSYDDGMGNLVISSSAGRSTVGRVFYNDGVVVINGIPSQLPAGGLNNNGISIVNGSSVNVQFSSSVILSEHQIRTKILPSEFTMSPYTPDITSVIDNSDTRPVIEFMASQSIKPYVTTIGLYNSNNDLMAVAKLSVPVERTFETDQTFVIKFDT